MVLFLINATLMSLDTEDRPDYQEHLDELRKKDAAEMERVGLTRELGEAVRAADPELGDKVLSGEAEPRITATNTQVLSPDGSTVGESYRFGITFDTPGEANTIKFESVGYRTVALMETRGEKQYAEIKLSSEQTDVLIAISERVKPGAYEASLGTPYTQ